MTELSNTILSDYQVRKTRKQKDAFIELMQTHLPDLQVETGGPFSCKNLVVGDVERAEVVIGAHYDTCAQLPFPNLIAPKNFVVTILYALLIALPFFLLMRLCDPLIERISDSFAVQYWLSLAVFFIPFLSVFVFGPANKHNANDNTSGVITLIELMDALDPAIKARIAFVFFDHEENGLLGSAQFKKAHKKAIKGKLMLNFDCVSDGDHILAVLNKPAMKLCGEHMADAYQLPDGKVLHIEKSSNCLYPSDQGNFDTSIAFAALKKKPLIGLYLDRIHTKRDTVFDEANIALLVSGTKNLLESIL